MLLSTPCILGTILTTDAGIVVGAVEWTPRKLEKQRSVTFATIDQLEPIEEDFPQV